MKKMVLAAAFAVVAGAAWADPVEGVWQTIPDDNGEFGHVQIAPCGDKLCGTLIRSYDQAGKPKESENIGKMIVWDMVAQGGGAYGSGKVWSPDRDKTYNSKMQMNGNALAVEGCVLFVCRDGGTWTRVQ
ncbi:DUF2147 domain-containing protein [Phaeovulum sp.]|uniref:DUF2147 domain-containing protein n=1 Tax=Phaeovulum sp. TaxID=2934796 RepID=UPI003568DF13